MNLEELSNKNYPVSIVDELLVEEDVADVDGEGDAEGVQHLSDEELLVVRAEAVPELDKAICNLVRTAV